MLSITLVAGIISILLELSLPNMYKSTAYLAPYEDGSSTILSGITQQFASFTGGILSGPEIATVDIALATIVSKRFITDFIERHDILVPLFTVKKLDKSTNTIIYDPDLYDREAGTWLSDTREPGSPPTKFFSYSQFQEFLTVVQDDLTSFVTISFEFPEPELARQWSTWLVEDINEHMRERAVRSARTRSHFLQEQLGKTSVADIRNILFHLIQNEMQMNY